MAYLRQKGNQLIIVHGVRNRESGKVEQMTLFTFYSKAEALAALGKSEAVKHFDFKSMVEAANPGIRFNWSALLADLEKQMDILPDLWNYREARLGKTFRAGLVDFTRQLLQADPQWRFTSAQVLAAHKNELEYLKQLIDWRLSQCNQKQDEWNRDTPFFWFHALPPDQMDLDEEERAKALYLNGEHDKADALFRLFVECYPTYADGYNYLGLIAQDRNKLNDAIEMYNQAIEVGRRLFPKRTAKKDYWNRLETRPYIRGLRNLGGALNRAGRYDEALRVCERLDTECGDDMSAAWHRGEVYLNLGRWDEAYRWCRYTSGIWPERNALTALAAFELGRKEEAAALFLCGLLNSQRAARMLVGLALKTEPKSSDEIASHNAGVDWCRSLKAHLGRRRELSRRFFRGIAEHPHTASLMTRLDQAMVSWRSKDESQFRTGFDLMNEMKSLAFAKEHARLILEKE